MNPPRSRDPDPAILPPDAPRLRIAVIGAGDAVGADMDLAESLGRALGESGAVVVTGGLSGVMEAASRGCAEAGGVTLGVLPGSDPSSANPWVSIPIPTGLGEARNALVVRAGEAVVAVGGGWGTLSEIALARKMGKEVAILGNPSWDLPLRRFETGAEAAEWALRTAASSRSARGFR